MPLLELLENLTFPKSVSSSRKTVASCGRRLLKLGKQCDLGCFRAVVANMVEPSPGNWYRMVVVAKATMELVASQFLCCQLPGEFLPGKRLAWQVILWRSVCITLVPEWLDWPKNAPAV